MRWAALAGLLAIGLVACGAPAPTPPPPARLQAACFGLDATRCDRALAALAANMPGVTPSYVAVSERLCDGPCPGSERGAWVGHLLIDFADGRKSATVLLGVDGEGVDWELIESALVEVSPSSRRLAQPTTDYTLGHCGLASGIDVDGSFWDPVGLIDPNAPDLINSAAARFSLTSPDTATLVTERGAVVQLVRHAGPKWMFACD